MPASKRSPDLVDALALWIGTGGSVSDFACRHSIGIRTAHTWMKSPEFETALSALRASMVKSALGKLTACLEIACDICLSLAKNDPSSSIRLAASRGLLADFTALRASQSLGVRVEELAARVAEIEKGGSTDADAIVPGREHHPN